MAGLGRDGPIDFVFCSGCGNQIAENVAFCASCGSRVGPLAAPAQRPRRNPLVVALLVVIALMVVVAGVVVFTIAGVAVPKMQRAVRQAAEVSAVQQIHMIQTAQAQYFAQFRRYAASLAELGPTGADLIPSDLASGVKDGYRFALQGDASGYRLQALPVTYGKTGVRTFYADESGVVRQNVGPAPATGADQELP